MARKDTAATQAPKETRNPFKRTYDVYKTVKMIDPKVGLWMLLAFAVVIAVGLLIGWLTGHPWLTLIVAIPAALLAAMVILARRGEAAAFAQMEGQKGATLGGLKMMRRGWYYD